MATVGLIGTLDTKGDEYAFVQRAIEDLGCKTIGIDVGISSISIAGGVFHDAEADRALIAGLKDNLDPDIVCVTANAAINDEQFALAMARELGALMQKDARE
jgi:uncharacterized protein (UPF0261 family)